MTTFEIEPGRLFIGGQWREAGDGERTEVVDPSRGAVVTTVAEAGAADVDAAVRAARAAFDGGRLVRAERPRTGPDPAPRRCADPGDADEIAPSESLDVGKPVSLCHAVDVATAAEQYEYYAAPRAVRWRLEPRDSRSTPTPTPGASRSAWSPRSPRSTSR